MTSSILLETQKGNRKFSLLLSQEKIAQLIGIKTYKTLVGFNTDTEL